MTTERTTKTEGISNLLSVMNIPASFNLSDITKTSDGFYMGLAEGDIGFNHFIGQPSAPHSGPGRERMLLVWEKLPVDKRLEVLILAIERHIDLKNEFGLPIN